MYDKNKYMFYFFTKFLKYVLTQTVAWNIIIQCVLKERPCLFLQYIFKLLFQNLEVDKLANIKSAKKRILVTETRTARNKAIRSEVKTSIKKVEAAVVAKDKAAAEAALKNATSVIESACSKGVYHKNNAARKVSRLTKLVNGVA